MGDPTFMVKKYTTSISLSYFPSFSRVATTSRDPVPVAAADAASGKGTMASLKEKKKKKNQKPLRDG